MRTEKQTFCFKVTDQNNYTKNFVRWGPCVRHTIGESKLQLTKLCSGGFYHAFLHPALAMMLKTDLCEYDRYKYWIAIGYGEPTYSYYEIRKVGFRSLMTVKQVKAPKPLKAKQLRELAYKMFDNNSAYKRWHVQSIIGDIAGCKLDQLRIIEKYVGYTMEDFAKEHLIIK